MEYYQRISGTPTFLDKLANDTNSTAPPRGSPRSEEKEDWEYPYYYTVYLARSFKTGAPAGSETCAAVTEQEALAEMSEGGHAVDPIRLEAALSIFNKGFGCFSCPASEPGHTSSSGAYYTLQDGKELTSEM